MGTGSGVPKSGGVPAYTVPVIVVSTPPPQFCCCRQRPVHALLPQTPGVPPPPHVKIPGQVSPHWITPPQPSPAGPQLKPCFAQVVGLQLGAPSTPRPLLPPHTLKPPPPQYCGFGQAPEGGLQSSRLPQPSLA